MLTIIVAFYIIAITISLLHLAASAVITARRIKNAKNLPVLKKGSDVPSVSVFKPLKGLDDQLEENLRSFFGLDYENFELVFGLSSKADPAYAVVRRLMAGHPHISAKLVVSDFEIGLNPKINNLYNMNASSTGDYILISDSNTRVQPDFLRLMVPAIQEPGVSMVTGTIRGLGARRPAAMMENLHINSYISPNVFVAEALSGIPVVIGKSILMSRRLLEQMGGFEAFKNYLAEDYLLGLRTRELGQQVRFIPAMVDNVNVNWSLKRFLNRHTRWAKMRRSMHLHHYFIESFSNPVALSLILFVLLHNIMGTAQLALVTLLKIMHDRYISHLLGSDLRGYQFLLIPLKDLIMSALWLVPFFSHKVNWRNNLFRIGKKSSLQAQPALNR